MGHTKEFHNKKHLAEVDEFARKLSTSLPKSIAAGSLTLKSKIPFNALSAREILIHRMAAITCPAVDLFKEKKSIPAIILTRSAIETVSVTYALHERISSFLKNDEKEINELGEFLVSCMVGTKNNPQTPPAINVLTHIDRIKKALPEFRNLYDGLSEFAHPNWAGTFGAFGKIDHEKFELNLGESDRSNAYAAGLASLSLACSMFETLYNELGDLIPLLNDHFESQ